MHKSPAELADLFESAMDAIVSIDEQHRILLFNPAAEIMFGYRAVEVEAQPLEMLLPQRAHATHAEEVRAFGTTGVTSRRMGSLGNVFGRRKNGEEFPAEVSISQVNSGTEKRFIAILRDITERVRLEQSLSRLAAIVDSTDDAIISKSLDGFIESWNRGATQLLGYTAAEVHGRHITLLIPENLQQEEIDIQTRIRNGESIQHFDTQRQCKDGTILDVCLTISPIKAADGRVIGISKIMHDITARKQAEQKIQWLNRGYHVLSEINSLIIKVRDQAELFAQAVRIATDIGRFTKAWIGLIDSDELYLQLAASCGDDSDFFEKLKLKLDHLSPALHAKLIVPILAQQPIVINDLQTQMSNSWTPEALVESSGSAIFLPLVVAGRTKGVFALHADLPGIFNNDEIKLLMELAGDIGFAINNLRQSERLNYLAYYDKLTGLANTTLFRERLAQQLHGGDGTRRLALVLLDIKRFKSINDTLGRRSGDLLLQQIAERLATCAGGSEYVGYLNTDHYALMLPDLTNAAKAVHILDEGNQSCFGRAFTIGDVELKVSAKMGVALFPDDCNDVDTLFANAESALKAAKTADEHYLFYSATMNEQMAERLILENKLRMALELDQFVLHYQPKIESISGHIVGVEALIRWNDPETGLVPPIKFISILEETGLIVEVGAWVLRTATRDFERWLALGLVAPRIAVNVSAVQLRRKDFVDVTRSILTASTSPSGIDIEITESLIMEDIEGSVDKLKLIREMGACLALDDFGTGYSSLAYLAKLPIEILKIDRSFIITMLHDANTMTLVSTIITLAHSLGLKVVAEGVDEEEQAKILRLIRCDQMQGYLFSKPLPFEEISLLLTKR